jgi:hypothetical protein
MTAYTRLQAKLLCNSSPDETGTIMKLQMQLSQLWELHGGESDSARVMAMSNRAMEVLKEVAKQGWEGHRSFCESTVEVARWLWGQCEVLVIAAAEVDEMDEKGLLFGCKRLLAASDVLIASEEEIVHLMDTGTENYGFAYKNGELCWQQHFS